MHDDGKETETFDDQKEKYSILYKIVNSHGTNIIIWRPKQSAQDILRPIMMMMMMVTVISCWKKEI